jgi:hypothetical protein
MTHLDVCAACNTAMITVEPDQITHPCCDPDDTTQPVLNINQITELIGDLGRCQDCGQPARSPGLTSRCQPRHKAAQR